MLMNLIINLMNTKHHVRSRGRKEGVEKRGSIITEAAIMLPVYIIAVVTFIYITRVCHTDIIIFSTVENEVRESSAQSFAPLFPGIGEAVDASGLDRRNFDISWIPSGIMDGSEEIDSLYKVTFKYDTKIAMPAVFKRNVVISNAIVVRNWKGKEISGAEAFGFSRMASDESGNIVCVFPRAGGRYHGTDCRYVNSYAAEATLDAEIRKKYKPCPLCSDGNEATGSTVYIFRYGGSYHNSGCNSVDKYVIDMDRADAVIKNYSPCSVCGGK